MKNLIRLIVLSLAAVANLRAVEIAPTDERITFQGVHHTLAVNGGLELLRFSDETLAQKVPKSFFNVVKARTTSGCVIRFVTNSSTVTLKFLPLTSVRQIQFSVYQDGKLANEFDEDKGKDKFVLESKSLSPGKDVLYEVVMPSWASPAFAGLTIDEGSQFKAAPPDERPLYAAVGDSITHGTGQQSRSDWTYPWLLAKGCGWRLVNFAVGGSTTSPTLVPDIVSAKPDVITILWGYNDWQNKQFTLQQYDERYRRVVETLREGCPAAAIFCITPITTNTESAVSGLKMDDYRAAVVAIVTKKQEAGDKRIFLIRGEELTSVNDVGDGIHFTPQGAKKFAGALKPMVLEKTKGPASLQ